MVTNGGEVRKRERGVTLSVATPTYMFVGNPCSLLFSLFFPLFMGFIVLFDTIYEFYNTILAIFQFYLLAKKFQFQLNWLFPSGLLQQNPFKILLIKFCAYANSILFQMRWHLLRPFDFFGINLDPQIECEMERSKPKESLNPNHIAADLRDKSTYQLSSFTGLVTTNQGCATNLPKLTQPNPT